MTSHKIEIEPCRATIRSQLASSPPACAVSDSGLPWPGALVTHCVFLSLEVFQQWAPTVRFV